MDDFGRASSGVLIRRVRDGDEAAVSTVTLATGLLGQDASRLYEDPSLIGQIYSLPYVRLEPDLALVAEDAEGVGGYAVGVGDTAAWEARLEREWWPELRARYPEPPADLSEWSADQAASGMFHRPSRVPPEVSERHPSHLHLNLMPRMQRLGLGGRLLERWLVVASSQGVRKVHVGVGTANDRALRFWSSNGFEPLVLAGGEPETVWMGRTIAIA